MNKTDIKNAGLEADQRTDNVLMKIAKSRWSWLIMLGIVSVAFAAGFYAEQLNPLQFLGC